MPFEFKLPDIGEGVHEGEIVSWLVKEGEQVKEDQPLVEVMTDKATVEIPSPAAGVILKLNGKEGEIVKVGSILVVIGKAGEMAAPAAASAADGKATSQKAEAAHAKAPAANSASTAVADRAPTPPTPGRVLATPATRKLARELGIDISQVQGTGPAGRVTDEDVKRFLPGGATTTAAPLRQAPQAAPVAPMPKTPAPVAAKAPTGPAPAPVRRRTAAESEERIPLRGIRKRISDHMHHSKNTAAHFTYVDEVDMTQLVKVRGELKAVAEKQGVKLTFLPFIIKACVGALKKHPTLNASVDHEKQEIILKNYYNIGVATATDQGLIVPVVKAADQLSMVEIASEVERLSAAARDGKIALEEIQGSTFTITSLGVQGGLFATPIINTPELAIMGIHEIKKRPVVIDNEIVVRDIMLMSLSFDHRIIDGHIGAAFAKDVKAFLEDPKWLLVGA